LLMGSPSRGSRQDIQDELNRLKARMNVFGGATQATAVVETTRESLPAVMRLLKMVRVKDTHRAVKFSRINIFTRDGYACQYCNHKFRTEDLTFDHVVPIAKGGRKTWENIVTACWRCNNRKSGRTPDEAGMRLIRKPVKPRWNPVITITIGIRNAPESWRDYLYWNMELDDDSDN
jgi:hypothetical protein